MKNHRPLKKLVYSLTESKLKSLIAKHEDRGWKAASDIKPHGYGVGCLMIFDNGRATN
ncbi:hypothetical protein JOD21_000340 [Jeotgalibacillus terrae]|nr:hypothetical protein [Jeotgalibacillus terrae]